MCCGCENRLRIAPDCSARIERAGLGEDGQAGPRRAANEDRAEAGEVDQDEGDGIRIDDVVVELGADSGSGHVGDGNRWSWWATDATRAPSTGGAPDALA